MSAAQGDRIAVSSSTNPPTPRSAGRPVLDAALAAKAVAGDAGAFEVLVVQHGRYWLALAYAKTGNMDNAQDALQEAMLLAWRQRGTLRSPEHFTSWMSTIVLRTCSTLRRRRQAKAMSSLEALPDVPEASARSFAEAEARGARRKNLAAAVGQLDEEDQCVLAMRYGLNLRYREIAERLQITETAVRGRLHRVRDQLRGMVRRAEA